MVIQEVHDDMVPQVKEFLVKQEDFGCQQNWEGLFNYRWKRKEYPYGYAAMDGDKLVAFIGTIYSERVIEGKKVPYCNMSTWIVDRNHRSMLLGLLILERIFRIKDVFISSLTPSNTSRDISEKMGFRFLENEQITIPILPRLAPFPNGERNLVVSFDVDEISKHLNEEHRIILEDHRDLACKHFLVKEKSTGAYCYGVGTAGRIRRLKALGGQWFNLCYLSDADVFVRNFRYLKKHFLQNGPYLLFRYDSRLIPGSLSSIERKVKRARQFKSKEFTSCHLDNLYSELVTFNKY